jgi:hypothetical protein
MYLWEVRTMFRGLFILYAGALVGALCVPGSASAEFRIGVVVENADDIHGARITSVFDGSVADTNLGLREGDVIRYIRSDRQTILRIQGAYALYHALGRTQAEVTVYFLRGGKLYSSRAKKGIATYSAAQEVPTGPGGDPQIP